LRYKELAPSRASRTKTPAFAAKCTAGSFILALFPIWVDITDRILFLLLKYLAFLEKGWGLGKGKTSFLVKRSFSLPQEPSTLIGNSAKEKSPVET